MAEETKKPVEKVEETKEEVKTEVKEKKTETKKVEVKEIAVANAYSLKVSFKQCKYVCRMIRGKTPDAAVERLQAVIDGKRPVPMAGLEVAHQKGKGIAGAKFPKNACKEIMEVVKQVKANAAVAGIENPVITIVKADLGSRPYRRQGQQGKRTHIHMEVKDKSKLVNKKARKSVSVKGKK